MSLASTAATLPLGEDQLPDVDADADVSTGAVVSAGSEVDASELGSTGVLSVIAGSVDPGVLLPESSPHAGTTVSTSARAGAASRYREFIRMGTGYPWRQPREREATIRH